MRFNAEELLRSKGMHVTNVRLAALRVFIESSSAMSQQELASKIPFKTDRVTIYRTLNIFLEKGILHKVVDTEGETKFALCLHEHHHDEKMIRPEDFHPHFKCSQCDRIICLEDIQIPEPQLPPGYILENYHLSVSGYCAACAIGR